MAAADLFHCSQCNGAFETDWERFKGDKLILEENSLPVSCSKCPNTICCRCLRKWQVTFYQQGRAQRFVDCAKCKSTYGFDAKLPNFNFLACSLMVQLQKEQQPVAAAAAEAESAGETTTTAKKRRTVVSTTTTATRPPPRKSRRTTQQPPDPQGFRQDIVDHYDHENQEGNPDNDQLSLAQLLCSRRRRTPQPPGSQVLDVEQVMTLTKGQVDSDATKAAEQAVTDTTTTNNEKEDSKEEDGKTAHYHSDADEDWCSEVNNNNGSSASTVDQDDNEDDDDASSDDDEDAAESANDDDDASSMDESVADVTCRIGTIELPGNARNTGWNGFNDTLRERDMPLDFQDVIRLMDFLFTNEGEECYHEELWLDAGGKHGAKKGGMATRKKLRDYKKREPEHPAVTWHQPRQSWTPPTKHALEHLIRVLLQF